MRPLAGVGLFLTFAVVLGAGGCNYFRPAEPEPPLPGSVIIPDYSYPDSTLSMIGLAIADKGQTNGSSVYIGAFAESTTTSTPAYHQLFSDEDIAVWQQAQKEVPDWTLRHELTFYNRLINLRGDLYRLVWTKDPHAPQPDNIGSDQAIIYRHYQLTTMAEDSTFTSTLAVGYADLTLMRGTDGNWRIVLWQDRLDPSADPQDPEAVTMGRRRLNSAG